MRIVMDFDGVFTDPTVEGEICSKNFRDKITSLNLKEVDLHSEAKVDSWLGELRARQASFPFDYGWRSEGRVSAFTFEDPFIRNIGLADFLDAEVAKGDARAKLVLQSLKKTEKIASFGELSTWAFHQLNVKKRPDPETKKWIETIVDQGHEVFIVSNSATDKISEFLGQAQYSEKSRPQIRGGAKKFSLGNRPQLISLGKVGNQEVSVDTDRPFYEAALKEVEPDAIVGDVFCLDLALPIRLKREGKLKLKAGIFYKQRDYTPSPMLELIAGRGSVVPEVTILREWNQVCG